jgi:hypothetical protein
MRHGIALNKIDLQHHPRGAQRKCYTHPGCSKHVKLAERCSTHGPSLRRCAHEGGCTNIAVQRGRCVAHGAQRRMCCYQGGGSSGGGVMVGLMVGELVGGEFVGYK